jgi:Do/DeqQ family serine protease
MSLRNLALIFTVLATSISLSCRTNLLGGGDAPAEVPVPQQPPAPVSIDGVRTSYADVVERTSPAVVRIESDIKTRGGQTLQFPFGDDDMFRGMPGQPQPRPQLQRGIGSGVIVSADGTILTNNHVVEGADRITVQMSNDKTFEAKIVGADKPSDLAVLKIEAQNMPFLTLGNSDNVRVGDIVLAIGNPLGIGQTVTAGIISAKGRRTGLSDGTSFEDFLQTDAPINRGNSGGALVNLSGELIGINSQILSPGGAAGGNIGIGFSIPSNMAKTVMEQLLKDGKVHRGQLGIWVQNITDDTAKALDLKDTAGVLVSDVNKGSAAERAGLKRGDIITAINGEKIEDSNVFRNKVAGTPPGSEIKLTVSRDGSTQEMTAKLDEFDVDAASRNPAGDDNGRPQAEKESGRLGLSLQPVTPDVARQLKLNSNDGLVITDIDPTGPAAEAGLTRGDVILEINKQSVATADDVRSAIDKSGARPLLMLVVRQGRTIYLTVRPS